MEYLFPFIFGLTACFIGALPLGAINLSVVSLTVNNSYQHGIRFAFGASLVEIGEALIAVLFGRLIGRFFEEHTEIPYLIAAVFFGVGIYFFLRKTSPKLNGEGSQHSNSFLRGLFVAFINPLAIPFWLFALAFIAPHQIEPGVTLYIFLTGVFIGKLVALYAFAKTSGYLKKHLAKSCNTIDYIMGVVFISIGLLQVIKQII